MRLISDLEIKLDSNMTRCAQCNTDHNISVDFTGYPLYYFGAGPNNPQDAEVYFCGAQCANDYKRAAGPVKS